MVDLSDDEAATRADGASLAHRLGALLRRRRTELGMNQSDLALATGVGRRFIIDLEAGKPSCHIGKALLVAETLGIRVVDLLEAREKTVLQLPATGIATGPPSVGAQKLETFLKPIDLSDLDLPDDLEEPGP